MHELKCPNCGKTFNIDGAGYADILSQVRDEAFDKALHERLTLAEQDKKTAVELAETKVASQMEKEAAKKDSEIARLKEELKSSTELVQAKVTSELKEEVAKKDAEIAAHEILSGCTGVPVYFADPHSPWQRPTNENGNGLLRRYVGKGTDLAAFTKDDLWAIEHRLSTMPRRVLGWKTADEVYAEMLR